MRRIPSQVVTLETSIAEAESARTDEGVALVVTAEARNIMEVRRMLEHLSEDITRKAAEAMGIATTDLWLSCEACLQAKAKQHAVSKMTN